MTAKRDPQLNRLLEQMRQEVDPLADDAVRPLFAQRTGEVNAANKAVFGQSADGSYQFTSHALAISVNHRWQPGSPPW